MVRQDRQKTDRQKDRKTDRQSDRHAEIEGEREKETDGERKTEETDGRTTRIRYTRRGTQERSAPIQHLTDTYTAVKQFIAETLQK